MFLINPYILGGGGVIPTANLFAYSFRKVVSSATVSFRVRRSSDNAEQDIGFVGDDLDTTSLTSFVGANNGFVTKIYEQNGTGKDLTQATASSQFQIVNAGTIYLLNGKPTCVTNFGKYLFTTTSMFNFVASTGISVFSVTQPISQIGGFYDIDFIYSIGDGVSDASGSVLDGVIMGSAGNPTNYRSRAQGTTSLITPTYTSGTKIQSHFTKNGEHKYYLNNSLEGTNTPTLVDKNSQLLYINTASWFPNLSNSQYANQYFSEILVYDSYEDSNVNSINTNINNYYGIY